jgi:hypothetical protein
VVCERRFVLVFGLVVRGTALLAALIQMAWLASMARMRALGDA